MGFLRRGLFAVLSFVCAIGVAGSAAADDFQLATVPPATVSAGGSFDVTLRHVYVNQGETVLLPPVGTDAEWLVDPLLSGQEIEVVQSFAPVADETLEIDTGGEAPELFILTATVDTVYRITAPTVTEDTDVRYRFQLVDDGPKGDGSIRVFVDFTVRVLAHVPEDETEEEPSLDPVTNTAVDVAQQVAAVQGLQSARVNALMREQPDLSSVFDSGTGAQGVTVSSMGNGLAVAAGMGGPVWAEVRANRSVLDGGAATYTLGSVGAHWMPSQGVALGLMALTDRMETEQAGGRGWLAGPYAVFRVAGQPLVLQLRYLAGKGRNRLDDGSRFDSRRTLAMVMLSGSVQRGAVEIVPSLRATRGREVSEAFSDAAGLSIPSQVTALTQVETGLSVDVPLGTGGATRLRLGLADIWTDGNAALDGHRGEVSVLLRHRTAAGGELTLRLARDGLAMAGFKATRVAVNFSLAF